MLCGAKDLQKDFFEYQSVLACSCYFVALVCDQPHATKNDDVTKRTATKKSDDDFYAAPVTGSVDIIPAKHLLRLVAQILAGRVTVTGVPVPLVLLVGTVNFLLGNCRRDL